MEVYKNRECLTLDTFKMEVEGVEVGVFPQWEAEDRRGHRRGGLRVSVSSQRLSHQQAVHRWDWVSFHLENIKF